MDVANNNFGAILPHEHLKEVLKCNTRHDGRHLFEFRNMTINVGSIDTADGSALVQMGNTMIVCGVKAELTKPLASQPHKGIVVPNVELPPLCASHFKPGPPSDQAQIASQLLSDIIKSPNFIDLEQLCVCKDKIVWVIYCDVVCLSYDGNMMDAAVAAVTAALANTLLPVIQYKEDDQTVKAIQESDKKVCLPLKKKLVSSTFSLFQSSIIIADPTLKEEQVAGSELTVIIDQRGIPFHLHRPGGFPLEDGVLQKCLVRAVENSNRLQVLLSKFCPSAVAEFSE